MRLNRYVAAASTLSRRGADDAIAAGRVAINDHVATLGAQVIEGDSVSLDGRPLTAAVHRYIMLNKPAGYVTSRRQQGSAPTIYRLLPPAYQGLNPVGRLDKDSSGLLILTNDGDFAQRAGHPSSGKTKTYELELNRPLSDRDARQLAAGVELDDGPSRPEIIKATGAQLTLMLEEGRNRQLRRTMAALGYKVRRLERTSFGPYELDNLATGEVRAIDPEVLS